MDQRTKVSDKVKKEAVQAYLDYKGSMYSIATQYGLSKSRFAYLVKYALAHGVDSIIKRGKTNYTPEFKRQVAEEYLRGDISLIRLAIKHNMTSSTPIQHWVRVYKEQRNDTPLQRGDVPKMKSRKTTEEERLQIVQECLTNEKNYQETAIRNQVSYGQVYSWTKKFEAEGIEGLRDRRGRGKSVEEMSENERLAWENKMLKSQIQRLEIEIELKKKLEKYQKQSDSFGKKK